MSKAKAKTPKAKTPKAKTPKAKTQGENPEKAKTPATKPPRRPPKTILWDLRLYVAGRSAKSVAALDNLKFLCEEQFKGRYRLEVIDVLENPELAKRDQILAIPTLVRKLPPPIRKIIGDLSNSELVLVGLDVQRSRTNTLRRN